MTLSAPGGWVELISLYCPQVADPHADFWPRGTECQSCSVIRRSGSLPPWRGRVGVGGRRLLPPPPQPSPAKGGGGRTPPPPPKGRKMGKVSSTMRPDHRLPHDRRGRTRRPERKGVTHGERESTEGQPGHEAEASPPRGAQDHRSLGRGEPCQGGTRRAARRPHRPDSVLAKADAGQRLAATGAGPGFRRTATRVAGLLQCLVRPACPSRSAPHSDAGPGPHKHGDSP